MESVLVLALLAGLDNLNVSTAIGLSGVSHSRKLLLAGMFGLCEAAMPFLGLFIGAGIDRRFGEYADWIGPVILLACGVLILYQVMREGHSHETAAGNGALFALPLGLSIDNLFAGVGLGVLGYPIVASALTIGVVSGSMCFVGMFLGGRVRRWIPGNVQAISGVYMVILAGVMLS